MNGVRLLVPCLMLGLLFGCSNKKAKTRDELMAEKQNLPALYLSKKTHTRVIAPKNKGFFVDPTTQEECWLAQQCTNPDCPGRTDKEPYLVTPFDISEYNGCPACAKKRNYKADSPKRIAENLKFIKPYDLPEVEAKAKALDEQIRLSFEAEMKGRK